MMRPEEHTVTHTINRYRSFRYALILEGVAVGAIAGVVVVAFRYLLGYAEILLHNILILLKNWELMLSIITPLLLQQMMQPIMPGL